MSDSSDQEESASQQVKQLVEQLPSAQRRELFADLAATNLVEATMFHGPMPPPDAVEHYSRIDPSFPDRLLKIVEEDAGAARQTALGMVRNDRLRIHSSTITGLAMIVVAGIAVWLDQPVVAGALGLAGPLVAAVRPLLEFLNQRRGMEPEPPSE